MYKLGFALVHGILLASACGEAVSDDHGRGGASGASAGGAVSAAGGNSGGAKPNGSGGAVQAARGGASNLAGGRPNFGGGASNLGGGDLGGGGSDLGGAGAGFGSGGRADGGRSGGAGGSIVESGGQGGAADECPGALPLKCGDRVNHSTSVHGRADIWRIYNATQRLESGRETVYVFESVDDCSVVATLKNLTADLDLLLLPKCDAIINTQASSTPLDLQTTERVSWKNLAGIPSYLVVDGYDGDEGTYTLEVDCVCK